MSASPKMRYPTRVALMVPQTETNTMRQIIHILTLGRTSTHVTTFTSSLIALGLLLMAACSKEGPPKTEQKPPSTQKPKVTGKSNTTTSNTDKIKFKKPGGATAFSLKMMDNGLKLVDDSENEIARITISNSGKYKAKDSADEVLAYVTGNAPKFQIKNAAQDETLFNFQQQPDGDWKLESGDETLLCKIGKRDYGWKIEDANEKALGKVKADSGRTTVRDGDEKDLFYTNDSISSLAAVPFVLTQLSQAQAAALSAALSKATP